MTPSCSIHKCWIEKKPNLNQEIWVLLVALLHISCIASGKTLGSWSSPHLIQQQSFHWQHCELDSAFSPSLFQALYIPQWCSTTCALYRYLIRLRPFSCKAICYLDRSWMCNWIKFLIQQNAQTSNGLKSNKYILVNFRLCVNKRWHVLWNTEEVNNFMGTPWGPSGKYMPSTLLETFSHTHPLQDGYVPKCIAQAIPKNTTPKLSSTAHKNKTA